MSLTRTQIMRQRFERRMEFINSFKNKPCVDCGNTFPPECMDFDHLDKDTKFRNIARMISYKLDRIKEEISKCELVCSNCHRIRTKKRFIAG